MRAATNFVASFTAARKTFKQIEDQQPSNQYITSILKIRVPILYTLRWDVENGTHNLVGLLLVEAPYVKKHKEKFPRPTKRPGIYSTTLDKEDKEVVRVKGAANHKENQEDWALYEVSEKETAMFFAWAVPKRYLSALCEGPSMYMCDGTAMSIPVHLQKNVTGNHEIDILAL